MNWTHDFDRLQCDFGMPSILLYPMKGNTSGCETNKRFYKHNPIGQHSLK